MGSSNEAPSARAGRLGFDPATDDARLNAVLHELCDANEATFLRRGRVSLPSRSAIAELVDDLRAVSYPVHFAAPGDAGCGLRRRIALRLDKAYVSLEEQVRRGW